MTITSLAPYITLIAGIVVAFLTFKNQLRLKSFELLLNRREEVLADIEKEIKKLQDIRSELEESMDPQSFRKYSREYFHNGLMLYHKMKGANFPGTNTPMFIQNYYSVNMEKTGQNNNVTEEELQEWLLRKTNILSMIYSTAHSGVNKEIQYFTFPWYQRWYKKGMPMYEKFKIKRREKNTNQSTGNVEP